MIYIFIYGIQFFIWILISYVLAYFINKVIAGRRSSFAFFTIFSITFIFPFFLEAVRFVPFYSVWKEECNKSGEVTLHKVIPPGSSVFYKPGNWGKRILWDLLAEKKVDEFIVHSPESRRSKIEEKNKYWSIRISDIGDPKCSFYEKNKPKSYKKIEYLNKSCIAIEDGKIKDATIRLDHRTVFNKKESIFGRTVKYELWETYDMDTDEVLKDVYMPAYEDKLTIKNIPIIFQAPISFFGFDKCIDDYTKDITDRSLFNIEQ